RNRKRHWSGSIFCFPIDSRPYYRQKVLPVGDSHFLPGTDKEIPPLVWQRPHCWGIHWHRPYNLGKGPTPPLIPCYRIYWVFRNWSKTHVGHWHGRGWYPFHSW